MHSCHRKSLVIQASMEKIIFNISIREILNGYATIESSYSLPRRGGNIAIPGP